MKLLLIILSFAALTSPLLGIGQAFANDQTLPGSALPSIPAAAPETTEAPNSAEKKPVTGDFTDLRLTSSQHVAQIIDPLRLSLTNRQIVMLSGIEIPDLDPYDPGPISADVIKLLDQLLTNKDIRLYQTRNADKGRGNRMNQQLAQIERSEDKLWIQGDLLKRGLARALPTPDNPEMAMAMYAIEDQARKTKQGLWANEAYAVLTPDTAASHIGKFVLAEGTVTGAAILNNKVYLNFGPNWRDDFTVTVSGEIRRSLSKQGIDTLQLAHKRIRVRGWLDSWNGPHMALEHPTLLEILPEQEESAKVADTEKH